MPLDVELGPLAVQLGLSNVASVYQSGEVREPLAEHGRDEAATVIQSYQLGHFPRASRESPPPVSGLPR